MELKVCQVFQFFWPRLLLLPVLSSSRHWVSFKSLVSVKWLGCLGAFHDVRSSSSLVRSGQISKEPTDPHCHPLLFACNVMHSLGRSAAGRHGPSIKILLTGGMELCGCRHHRITQNHMFLMHLLRVRVKD